ncbi:MAG: OmpA family protein [Verrucomicrobiota bacterium]
MEAYLEQEEPRPSWLNWLIVAMSASLILHLFLFFWFRSLVLDYSAPVVDPIEPKSFKLSRSTIDPQYLQAEAQRIQGNQPEVDRQPLEILPGEIPSFSGPLNAPRIPTPTLQRDQIQPLSARQTIIPRDALSALPSAPAGKIQVKTQALADAATTAELNQDWEALTQTMLAGGSDEEVSGQGLPGADELSELMKPELSAPQPLLRPPSKPILITLSSELLFEFGSASLTSSGEEKLERVATYLSQAKDLKITIEGHTDSIDSEEFNLKLSQDRAQAVADWFEDVAGMDPNLFAVIGYGESRPLVEQTNDPVEERLNRRVEIRVEGIK